MATVTLQPTRITQPLAGKRITNAKGKYIKSPSKCRDGNAQPAYHPWEIGDLDDFLVGKQITCGRKSTYHCNLKTVNWIKGYNNTCPIAGCCGTFNRPAPLILDKFNFKTKKITKEIKISNVSVSYKHHTKGVDVGASSSSVKSNWSGYFPYVDIILYKGTTEIERVRHNKKVPLAKDSTVNATFKKAIDKFDPSKDNLRIEINYAGNGAEKYSDEATNPSIIYATGLAVNVTYEYIQKPKITVKTPTMSVTEEQSTIITDPRNPDNIAGDGNCRNTLTHTITYADTKASNITVSVPDGVKYTTQANQNSSITYVYHDTSGVAGEKTITYQLSDNQQTITKKYTAKLYTPPTLQIQSKYTKGQKYRSQDKFVTISNSCWSNIKIYVDGNQKLLIQYNNSNNSTTVNQQNFLNAINQLSCGLHTLEVFVEDISTQQFKINITAPTIVFESDLQGEYSQNRELNYVPITIKRTDSADLENPIAITVTDTASRGSPPQTVELYPQETYTQDINIRYPGTFELKYTYNNGCKEDEGTFGKYTVIPTHIQSYDNLLIRASDADIEYESIVIRKGDNQIKPVTYTDATLRNSINDFVLFAKDGVCALGELGYGILAIKNIGQQNIHNLCIELNPLIESDYEDEYNPLVMEWKTGMLQNFVENFTILNPEFKDVVEIFNIQNQDLINEGTENVVLCIKKIEPTLTDETKVIELKIPYMCSYRNEIYMNFLMFGEPLDFIDLDNETSGLYQNTEYYQSANPRNQNLFASHTSKQINRGCMCISLKTVDLLSTELSISGDDLDRNDLTNSNDLDIKYNINIAPEDCDDKEGAITFVDTEIINDARLIPTAYKINNSTKENFILKDETEQETTILDTHGNIRDFLQANAKNISFIRGMVETNEKTLPAQNVFLRYADKNNKIKFLRATTNTNGIATFQYIIPDYYQDNEDKQATLGQDTKTKYYLEDILNTVDIFYQGDEFHKPVYLAENQKYQATQTKINIWGILYKNMDGILTFENNDNAIKNIANNEFFIVGQLVDKTNNEGINNQIIEYHYPYITTSTNTKSFIQTAITAKNKTSLYGDDKQDLDGFFKIKITKPQFTHNISFSTYNNQTREQILNKYPNIDNNIYKKEINGICSYIVDGDTIDVDVQKEDNSIETIRVRLAGINTPEKNTQGYDTSKQFMSKICLGQQVSLDIDDINKTDKYGRTLAVVIVNNKNLNNILVQEKLADVMYIPPTGFDPYVVPRQKTYAYETYSNGVAIYNGDLLYQRSNSKNKEGIFTDNDVNKKETALEYLHDYGIYRRGETIEIAVKLISKKEARFVNTIKINHEIKNCGDTIHIFYKTCSTKNTEGFKTIFKTTSTNVAQNQTEEYIYCGVDTCLKILARLQKKIVENHNVNVLTINAINGYKPNKNVLVKAFIGPDADKQRLGDYLSLSAIDIDKEKYSYDQSSDIIYWNIGDMKGYETQICNVLLEGEHIGDNTIYVQGFDYLRPDEEQTVATNITLIRDDSEPEQYYVGDTARFKALLKIDNTNQDVFGQVYFDIRVPEDDYKTTAQAHVTTFNDEHYAIGHAKMVSDKTMIVNAKYEGAKILSVTYDTSDTYDHNYNANDINYITSNKALIYDNIKKYDTIIKLRSDQEEFTTNDNIQIIASVLYDCYQDGSETICNKKYVDRQMNIKFFVENQELNNVLLMNNEYVVNFAVTQPGEYVIKAFIPESNKTQECVDTMIINVKDGDNNE